MNIMYQKFNLTLKTLNYALKPSFERLNEHGANPIFELYEILKLFALFAILPSHLTMKWVGKTIKSQRDRFKLQDYVWICVQLGAVLLQWFMTRPTDWNWCAALMSWQLNSFVNAPITKDFATFPTMVLKLYAKCTNSLILL